VPEKLLTMLVTDIRAPRDFRGDMLALVGVSRPGLAKRRLVETFTRHVAKQVSAGSTAIINSRFLLIFVTNNINLYRHR